jgi:RNA-directed DNA polymerase
VFTGLGPAVSKTALKKMSAEVRSWRLHHYTTFSERDLARWINPIMSGDG